MTKIFSNNHIEHVTSSIYLLFEKIEL